MSALTVPLTRKAARRFGRALLWLLAAGIVALSAGCRARPAAPPEAAPAQELASPTFRLRHPAGQQPLQETRHATDLVLPNCAGAEPLTHLYTQSYSVQVDLDLDLGGLREELTPFGGVMAAVAREAYRLAGSYPPAADGQVELRAPAGARQAYHLVWVETWDRNVLEIVLDDAVVAEAPVRILIGVTLRAEVGEAAACESAAPEDEDRMPLILGLGRPLEMAASSAPEMSAGACETPLAVTSAQQQVARYVAFLQAGDHAAAYDLLAESYRLRLPYRQYQVGYEPVRGLALCSLETIGEIGGARETVYATLRLTLEAGAAVEEQLWVARYEVLRSGPIASVAMYKALLDE
jgi:hypothetical protein